MAVADCRCQRESGYWAAAHVRPLTAEELAWADEEGRKRFEESVRNRRKDRIGRNELRSHQIGARGELAAAILLRIPWEARINTFGAKPDLDPDIEVRTLLRSRNFPESALKLKLGEPGSDKGTPPQKHRRFLLVTPARAGYRDDYLTEGASFDLLGWLYGHEGGQARFMADPGNLGKPAYFIPPEHLHKLPFDARHA